MNNKEHIQQLSKYLFWDVDSESIDFGENASYIIQRVLELGQLSDWKAILKIYGLERIVSIATELRTLDPKALSFISTISSTPRESFRCFTSRP